MNKYIVVALCTFSSFKQEHFEIFTSNIENALWYKCFTLNILSFKRYFDRKPVKIPTEEEKKSNRKINNCANFSNSRILNAALDT